MATRYIGDAVIRITYRDATYDRRDHYAGSVCAGKKCWHFEDLHAPAMGHGAGIAYDSPEAYDSMAESAVGFGSYYTTHNRGDDTPDWAPEPEVADAIDEATSWARWDEQGNEDVQVRRSKSGSAVKNRSSNPFTRLANPFRF